MRRRASICDLHIRTSELARRAAEGEIMFIERRRRPVAESLLGCVSTALRR